MTFAFISVPARLSTKSGAAHKGMLAAIERRLGSCWSCRAHVLNGEHVVKVASPLWGSGAEQATREAFAAAAA